MYTDTISTVNQKHGKIHANLDFIDEIKQFRSECLQLDANLWITDTYIRNGWLEEINDLEEHIIQNLKDENDEGNGKNRALLSYYLI